MKRKFCVERCPFGDVVYVGTEWGVKNGNFVTICEMEFKRIAGFLPKLGKTIPINISITKRRK